MYIIIGCGLKKNYTKNHRESNEPFKHSREITIHNCREASVRVYPRIKTRQMISSTISMTDYVMRNLTCIRRWPMARAQRPIQTPPITPHFNLLKSKIPPTTYPIRAFSRNYSAPMIFVGAVMAPKRPPRMATTTDIFHIRYTLTSERNPSIV